MLKKIDENSLEEVGRLPSKSKPPPLLYGELNKELSSIKTCV
jgi:hypothetical protein